MKITKIKIKNLYGIKEMNLDGSSVELIGTNGVGKTSVIDAIKFALTNDSPRDYIIRSGEAEGEIIIETDTGLNIHRKKKVDQADYKSIKEGRNPVASPESFLKSLFTTLQIDPVAFVNQSKKEQNKVILDLIEFTWDLMWIKEQFGEIPENIDYSQNILQVLYDIQAENGTYFQTRQIINREVKEKIAQIKGIGEILPANYNAEYWKNYDLPAIYKKLTIAQEENNRIGRAQIFADSYESKKRGLQADKEIAESTEKKAIENERLRLNSDITRLQAEIEAKQKELSGLDEKLRDKVSIVEADYEKKLALLDKDTGIAVGYMNKPQIDITPIQEEITLAEKMIEMLSNYKRMTSLQREVETLEGESEELTRKIQIARDLPGEILSSATLPIEGLTVENGIPLIHNMPVTNLSEGEKLDLCIDVTLAKTNGLKIILIDGVEKLSEANRNKLYAKCKDKGIQFIATRTTDDSELQVVTL